LNKPRKLEVVTLGRNGHGLREGSWAYEKGVSNKKADSWANLPARLESAGRRLRRVRIECLPYQETLQRLNSPRAVVFLDPPYWPSTRGAAKVYLHEFSCKEHKRLLHIVGKLRKARVILCGYRHELYNEMLDGWRRTDFKTKSYAASRARGCKRDKRAVEDMERASRLMTWSASKPFRVWIVNESHAVTQGAVDALLTFLEALPRIAWWFSRPRGASRKACSATWTAGPLRAGATESH
jgi:hypothetical protein